MQEVYFDRVPGIYGPCNAIYRFYVGQLFLKGAKQLVPNNQYPAKILVDVNGVDGMMNTVVARCNDYFLQKTHFADELGVVPKPAKKHDYGQHHNYIGRDTKDGSR